MEVGLSVLTALSAFPALSNLPYDIVYVFILLPGSFVIGILEYLEAHFGDVGAALCLIGIAVLGHYVVNPEFAVLSDAITYLSVLGVLMDAGIWIIDQIFSDVVMLKGDF